MASLDSFSTPLTVHFHKLHSSGIGRKMKQSEVISEVEEQKLWESGVLGVADPKSLQNAVFYTLGKMLCLRGGMEHRSLKLSQLERRRQPDHYIYNENVSKNRNGSFKRLFQTAPCQKQNGTSLRLSSSWNQMSGVSPGSIYQQIATKSCGE